MRSTWVGPDMYDWGDIEAPGTCEYCRKAPAVYQREDAALACGACYAELEDQHAEYDENGEYWPYEGACGHRFACGCPDGVFYGIDCYSDADPGL